MTDSNDDQEVVRTFIDLWEGVKVRLRKTDLPSDILETSIKAIDDQYKTEIVSDPPYGICFCETEDLLPQWREYGDGARGVSIGFDLNWFIKNGIKQQRPHPNAVQSEAIGCESVIYHSEEFEKQIAKVCYEALRQAGSLAWLKIIRPTFKHYSGFVKNPTFEIEKEIRIVYYPSEESGFSVKDVEISNLKNVIKKHYEIPWVKHGNQALKSICIGHCCKLNEDDIKKFLNDNSLDANIRITKSKCSYRPRD